MTDDAPKKGIEYKRDEDFFSGYANNVHVESTVWDVKLTFGQTDTFLGPNVVVQHTAITIPWSYAKMLVYLVQTHLAHRESEDGHVPVPKGLLAPPPTELPKEGTEHLKHPEDSLAAVQKLWKEFIEANPELKSED